MRDSLIQTTTKFKTVIHLLGIDGYHVAMKLEFLAVWKSKSLKKFYFHRKVLLSLFVFETGSYFVALAGLELAK